MEGRDENGERERRREWKEKEKRDREREGYDVHRECLAHEQVYLLVTDRYSAPIIEERPTLNSAWSFCSALFRTGQSDFLFSHSANARDDHLSVEFFVLPSFQSMPTIMSSLPKWIWIPFSFSSLFLSDGQNYIRDYKRKFYELFTSSFSMIRNDQAAKF